MHAKSRIKIAGIPFDAVTYEGALKAVEHFVHEKGAHQITTPNPEMVLKAHEDPAFKKILESAPLSVADGVGILWAAQYLYGKKILPEKVTGTDLMEKIVALSQIKKWRIFLLGARPWVAPKAIQHLKAKYPQAGLVGSYPGSPDAQSDMLLREFINHTKPDILFVAFGSPHQELWIHRNLKYLPSVKVAMGVGGAFDFFAGEIRRAPKVFRRLGLEWLWRLIMQPSRIGRIFRATVQFPLFIRSQKKV